MKFPIRLTTESSSSDPGLYRQLLSRQFLNTMMILLFGLLHVADGVVTYLGLSFTSVDEVNPLLNYVAGQMGLGSAIFSLKLVILLVITSIFFDRHSIKGRLGTVTLFSADTFYGWVVTNNCLLVISS